MADRRHDLEHLARMLTVRMEEVQARLQKLYAAIQEEKEELHAYEEEITSCTERIDEIERLAMDVYNQRSNPDALDELDELEQEHEQEEDLMDEMLHARDAHRATLRQLALQFVLLRKEWMQLQRKQRYLAVIAVRLRLIKLMPRVRTYKCSI